MNITIVEEKISTEELKSLARESYYPMIKGVVDIEDGVVAFGGEYHIDANEKLIEKGFKQENVWGFNVHLDKPREGWIEYISLINIRPEQNNFDMEVNNSVIRERMEETINSKIYE